MATRNEILAALARSATVNTGEATVSNLTVTGYVFGNGAFLTGVTGGGGNANYSNANVADYLASNANIAIVTQGNITTAANIVGAYILGNGAFLTGITGGSSTYGNANVADYLASNANITITTQGNVTANNLVGTLRNTTIVSGTYSWVFDDAGNLTTPAAGNTIGGNTISANYFIGNGAFLTGLPAGYSNANVADYLPVYAGNVSANNITAGNLAVDNNVVITGNLRVLGTTTTVDANTLVVGDKDIVIANGAQQASDANGAGLLVGSTGQYASMIWRYAGNLWDFSGNIAGDVGFLTNLEVVANITNLGNTNVTGNVTAQNFVGNGAALTGLNYTNYSNANAAAYLASNAAAVITTQANVTARGYYGPANGTTVYGSSTAGAGIIGGSAISLIYTSNIANVTANTITNLDSITPGSTLTQIVTDALGVQIQTDDDYGNPAAIHTWNFFANTRSTFPGNLYLGISTSDGDPNNVSANSYIYGNGRFLTGVVAGGSGTYGDSNVATYLASNSNVNIVTQGNVTARYFVGDAGLLANLPAGNYSNSNVNAYLGQFDGSIVPSADAVYDLGSNVNQWRSLWVSNSTIYLNRVPINVTSNNTLLVNGVELVSANSTANIDTSGSITSLSVETGTVDANAVVANFLAGNGANIFNLNLVDFAGNIGNGNVDDSTPVFNGAVYAERLLPLANAGHVTIGSTDSPFDKIYTDEGLYANNGTGNFAITVATGLDNVNGVKIQNFTTGGFNNLYVGMVNAATGITTAGNITAVNFIGNGASLTNLPQTYGNSNVATYLASDANIAITTQGNITTTANISAAYFIGNGSQLTGIMAAGSYSDANVANYLPAYTGNLSAGNLLIVNNTFIQGSLQVLGTTTFANATTLEITDKDIVIANGATSNSLADGAGIIVGSANNALGISMIYLSETNNDRWVVNPGLVVNGNATANNFTTTGLASVANLTVTNFATIAEGNVNGFRIGYRDIPQVSWANNATLALGDEGKHYYTASAAFINVPANNTVAFGIGTAIMLFNGDDTANCTVVPAVGVTLRLAGNTTATGNRTLTGYAVATLTKVAADTWYIGGAGVA